MGGQFRLGSSKALGRPPDGELNGRILQGKRIDYRAQVVGGKFKGVNTTRKVDPLWGARC